MTMRERALKIAKEIAWIANSNVSMNHGEIDVDRESIEGEVSDIIAVEFQRIADEAREREQSKWKQLKELCGHLQDGSQETVTLMQDDATRTICIKIGKQYFPGDTFEEALAFAAAIRQPPQPKE